MQNLVLNSYKKNHSSHHLPAHKFDTPEAEPPISSQGDIWLLGPHRIMCGNSLCHHQLQQLMKSIKPGLIVAMPPLYKQHCNALMNSLETIIKANTRANQIIVGLFANCGCLLTVCENSGRTAYMIASEVHVIDSIIQQWQLQTGQAAILESSGWSFNELLSQKKIS